MMRHPNKKHHIGQDIVSGGDHHPLKLNGQSMISLSERP